MTFWPYNPNSSLFDYAKHMLFGLYSSLKLFLVTVEHKKHVELTDFEYSMLHTESTVNCFFNMHCKNGPGLKCHLTHEV
jgi:hypothetical protein